MDNEITLTKEEQEAFRLWLVNKGYNKSNITKKQMTTEYTMFVAYNVLFN